MAESNELPSPDSEELASLVGSSAQRILYGFLYRRRAQPPTMNELRMFAADALGEDQTHIGRRVRELRQFFDLTTERIVGGDPRYLLRGWAPGRKPGVEGAISLKRRAEVLAPQRCAQCGRTPLKDQVRLVVDHRIPRSWGGDNEPENLQPLCEDCNAGKRDYYQTFEAHADAIRASILHDEPQKRIGELLRALRGQWVRTDLLSLVASAQDYQEDWQRRLRDLRFIGWEYEHQKRRNEGARVWTYYRLVRDAPWPDNVHAAITAEERRRKVKKARSDSK